MLTTTSREAEHNFAKLLDALREFDRIATQQGERDDGLTEEDIAAWVHESRCY